MRKLTTLLVVLAAFISTPAAMAGTLFIGADTEDFTFPVGTTKCPIGTLCDKIGKADVTGAVHNSTLIIRTDLVGVPRIFGDLPMNSTFFLKRPLTM